MRDVYSVIMAGGSGTRFWPASRRLRPKQLLALAGTKPLLRAAVDRVLPICGADKVYIATGAHLAKATHDLLPELGSEQLLIEPTARNTAPCLAWAAATIARKNPEAVIMALPSDPFIRDLAGYRNCLQAAVESARSGVITTIGIAPTHPETGYGYIEAAPGDSDLRTVKRFVEKPDRATAEGFLKNGRFFWNAGMFFYRACDMLKAVEQHLPLLADSLRELDQAAAQGSEKQALERLFPQMPAVSIDTGVMEHMDRLAVVIGRFGWSDLGSWQSISELAAKNAQGNSAPEGTILVDASNNHIVDLRSKPGGATALVGVENLVVVQTDDALLVLEQGHSQAVKQVVSRLRERGDSQLL